MPVNQDGEEVNEDGSPITDEQKETHDWTDVITLHNNSKVKPYSIEELATSSVPHTIPYLEVYRTNEVMYRPYKSPYLTEISTSDSGDSENSASDDSASTDESQSTQSSSSSNAPQYSTKSKNKRLSNELKIIVKNNFKKEANHKTLINRYMSCKTNKEAIGSVTNHSSVWLKSSVSPSSVNTAVYNVKHKYS